MKTSTRFISLFFLVSFFFGNAPIITTASASSVKASNNTFINSTLELSVCNSPSWTATSNITSTSATFSWASVSGAISYDVQTRLPNGTWYYTPGSPYNSTSATVNGFNPATTYEWRVRTNCSNWESSNWTQPITFTTLTASCDPPGWLDDVYVTENWASLQWSAIPGAISYSVDWRVAGGTWNPMPGSPFANPWIELGGLQSCTTYEWRVKTNCSGGMQSGWSYIDSFTTLCTGCPTPTWPQTISVTSTTATVHWDYVSGAVNYSVQIRLPGGSWSYVPGSPFSNTTVTIQGLYPNTTYEWRVRANCYGGAHSNWTNPVSFTTYGSSCEAPTWLGTTNITQTSATFNWDPVPGAISYSIQWRYAGSGTWYNLPGGPFYNTWVNVTGLQPGTAYEWRVRSNCSYWSESPWSYPAYFVTLGNLNCYTPAWTSTINISSNAATFSWSSVPGAQSYAVEIRQGNGPWINVPGSPTPYTTLTVYGLSPNTTYQWRVRTNCGYGQYSNWSYPITFTTLGGECNAPEWLYTTNITHTTATWDWDPVSGAVNYSIQWRVAGGTWYNLNGGPFYNTWVNVAGLEPCTAYEWRVKAHCGYGNYSNWSWPAYFVTLCNPTCNTPTWPSTLSVTSNSATVHWDYVSGAQNYQVQYRLPNGTWYDAPGSPTYNTTFTITGLAPNTTYEWRVRAYCGYNQYSPWTTPIQFTTSGGSSCDPPSWLSTTNITQNSAVLEWASVPGAVSYTVEYRIAGGTWYPVPGSPFSGTWVNLNGLQPGTNYEWRVKTNCVNYWSSWSQIAYFTTLPSGGGGNNDDCADAVNLSVGSSCQYTSGSNINSSPSSPAPMGPCYAGGYKDVWFKFTMPGGSNPQVTIRTTAGSLTDAVMEVYNGSSCSGLSFIACEDDNNNGNGSTMPVINLSGYSGQTIWVRIWGYNGSSGTFNICVFNYYSANYSTPIDVEGNSTPDELGIDATAEKKTTIDRDVSTVLHVMPNPASDVLNVSMMQTDVVKVSSLYINDMSGQRMFFKEYSKSDVVEFSDQLDVSQLIPGIYLLQLVTTQGIQTEKVIITR